MTELSIDRAIRLLERQIEYHRKYAESNREKIAAKQRELYNSRRDDPEFMAKKRESSKRSYSRRQERKREDGQTTTPIADNLGENAVGDHPPKNDA